ncbi:ABC transporter permease [Brachybacterium phenoliresistens]|uniref:ABC transporter permease n=2 Tax=Brachybacterium phenoliresistens TaxID=396014 RepID=Z9JU75_9MICO|nr:ABC transporter permease [Brachybacterium phenoliresistens]
MAIGFAVIVLIPLGANVVISLFSWRGGAAEMEWVGLGNYVDLLQDADFWKSFRNSLLMIVAIVVVPTLLGLVIAALLFNLVAPRYGSRIASILRGSFYLPQILPIAVAGFIWSWVMNTDAGAVNSALRTLGITNPPDWLGDPRIAILTVMLMMMWLQLGYPLVIFMAALGRVDPSLYEAADLDGASFLQQLRRITIPEIRPEIFIVSLTATVAALKVFAPILILTGGGPEGSTVVPSYYAYRNFFELSQVGYGSAIATVMAGVILVVALVMLWFQRRTENV